MDWTPTFRPDVVRVDETEDRVEALFDQAANRPLELRGPQQRLAARLDGKRTLEELLALAQGDDKREDVERGFRALLLTNLIEGSGTAIVERLRAVRRSGEAPPLVIEGSRFGCQGSGECCQNYTFGPLSDEDVARIASLDIASAMPELGPGPHLVTEVRADGKAEWYLKTHQDRCVFLRQDNRCGLHAAFGAQAKPGFCQVYPLRWLPTLEGLKVFDGGECASFAVSSRSGPTLQEDLPRIVSLLPKRFDLYHPLVFFERDLPVDYGHFVKLQGHLGRLVEARQASAPRTALAIGRLVRQVGETLARCPLAPGEPDLSLDALLARDPAPLFVPDPDPREGFAGVASLCDHLLRIVLPAVVRAAPNPSESVSARVLQKFSEVVQLVQVLATHRSDPDENDSHDYVDALAAMPAFSPEVVAACRTAFRHTVFGDRLLIEQTPGPGALRLSLQLLFSVFGARMHAWTQRARAVRPEDLSFGHYVAARTLRLTSVARLLADQSKLAWPAIEAVPALLGDA